MNSSNRVAETKALISFTVTASLFSHMQKNSLCTEKAKLLKAKKKSTPNR